MNNYKTSVKERVKSAINWVDLGTHIYVIDYSKFIDGLETEEEAENNAYTYWLYSRGVLKYQDERSRLAYENDLEITSLKS
tara:strand:- start:492 stop:734 length:243 start_codon:yes stop_codon:yes gene_type:complete